MAKPPTPAQASEAADIIADRMTRRAILGARFDSDLAGRVVSMLTELEADLVGQIAAIDVAGVNTASARRARLEKLLELARESIRSNYRRIRLMADKDFASLLTLEVRATRGAMSEAFLAVNYPFAVSLPTDSYMAALAEDSIVLGAPAKGYWDRQTAGLQMDFESAMRRGLQAGETVQQLAQRVRGGKRAGAVVRGIMDTSRRSAVAMVRTSAASVGNEARLAAFDANLDIIEAYQHLSRLDARTTDVCIARAGKSWNAQTRKPIGHAFPFQTPPIHWNCRSVLVVRVIGGESPTNQDGEAWVRSLEADAQNAVFGKRKAELFRAGSIELKDLFDQTGRPLTLRELQAATG